MMTTSRQSRSSHSRDPRQFNDKDVAIQDYTENHITRIQIRTGQLETNQKVTVVGQLTVWYGQQSQQHGLCSRLTNVKTADVKLKQNERIRRINVYKGFDGRIIGLQFKINNHETEVYGNKSKLVHPIKDPYNSPMFYCQYFIGTADAYLLSLNAHFGSPLKSPFCAKSRTTTPDNSSTCGTWSSNDSRLSNDESLYSTTQSEPMQRFELERSYNNSLASSGHYSLSPASNSLSSLQDAPLDVRELGLQTTRAKQNYYYRQTGSRHQTKLPPVKSHYVGKAQQPPPPPPHKALGQAIMGQASLALKRPIHTQPSFQYNHSNV